MCVMLIMYQVGYVKIKKVNYTIEPRNRTKPITKYNIYFLLY